MKKIIDGDIQFNKNIYDSKNSSGTEGQVLTRSSGSNGVEWKDSEIPEIPEYVLDGFSVGYVEDTMTQADVDNIIANKMLNVIDSENGVSSLFTLVAQYEDRLILNSNYTIEEDYLTTISYLMAIIISSKGSGTIYCNKYDHNLEAGTGTSSFIDVEELPVVNIDEQATYRIPVEGDELVGRVVLSNSMTICNTLRFNTNLTTNEVVAILSQLTYYNFNGYNINPIWSNATLTKIVFAYNYSSGKYSLLYTEDIQNPYNSTVIWLDDNGWALNSFDLGEAGISKYQSLPIGHENDKLTRLISMNIDFTILPKYQYWNYKNGIWTDLAKVKEEVPIIEIKDFLSSLLFVTTENDGVVALKTSGELSGLLTSQQIKNIINAREFILNDIYFTLKTFSNSNSNGNSLHCFTGKFCPDCFSIEGWETMELYFLFTVNTDTNEYHITYFATPINNADIMPVYLIEITDGVMTNKQKEFFEHTTQNLGALKYQNFLFKNYDTSTSNTYWLTYAGTIKIDDTTDKVCYSCIYEANIYTFSITHHTTIVGISDVNTEFTNNSIVDSTNYYKKNETYSKSEVDELISNIGSGGNSSSKEMYIARSTDHNAYMPVTTTPTNGAYFSDKDGNMITSSVTFPEPGGFIYIVNESLEIDGDAVQIGLIQGQEPIYFRKTSETTGYLSDEAGYTDMEFTLVESGNNDSTDFEIPTITYNGYVLEATGGEMTIDPATIYKIIKFGKLKVSASDGIWYFNMVNIWEPDIYLSCVTYRAGFFFFSMYINSVNGYSYISVNELSNA